MRKIVVTFWLVIINLLLLSNASIAANVSDANYGSVVIRDGAVYSGSAIGHAGVVTLPVFGNQDTTGLVIAQANGPFILSSPVSYSVFKGANNYYGHFKTYNIQWDSAIFRLDVVKFANQAMQKSYTGINLYYYAGLNTYWDNIPYTGIVPSDFRCDGVAEWSVEQALGFNGKTLGENIGFYTNNNFTHDPISISTLGTDDSAFPLTIDSDSPSSGVVINIDKLSLGHQNGNLSTFHNGSTGAGGTLKLLYSPGTTVTLTAPATAPNGNVFSTWRDCTAANGGTLDLSTRTCTTSMNMSAHYTASYVPPPVTTPTVPTVSTAPATIVTSNSASLNATIVSDGGSSILERRFDWGINGGAMTAYTANVSVSVNNFSYVLTGLLPNTTYKFRAWATNKVNPVSADWGTGGVLTFTTGSGAIPVNGVCSTSSGGTFTAAPTNLCSSGTATTVSGSGPWYWNCNGSNGGTSNSCSANLQSWTVTPWAGAGGTISPSTGVTVNHGFTTTFTVTPSNGYITASVSGCSGYLSGNTYTTGAITANCTVSATFSANPVPVNGVCGASSGATFTVAPTTNLCSSGTATTVSGNGPWSWSCNGSNGGTPASCSANVTPTASAPSCNISPATASIVSGAAQVFVANCTNSPTNFQWFLDGTLVGSGSINSYGTGTNLAVGSHTVTVTASNPSGPSVATSASLTINSPTANAAPVITSAGTASGTMNAAFSYPITASNSPTSYGASGLPAGLSVNMSNGLISGMPNVSGTFYATVTATNATGTGSMPVTITITTGAPTPSLYPTLSAPVSVAADGGQQLRIKKWGNNVYVLNGGANQNLMFYKSTDNGATFASTILASPVTNSYEYEFCMDTNGYLFALWESSNDSKLYIRKSLDGGTSWSVAASVASGFTWIDQPSCTFSNGTLYLLFRAFNNPKSELYLTKSSDNGSTFSTPVQVTINSTQEDSGKIAVYGNNVYVIYFDYYSASPGNIYLVSSLNGGASFGSPIQVNRSTGKSDFGPSMAVDGLGNLFVAYSDTTTDGAGDLYVAKSTNGGASFIYTLAADSTYSSQSHPRAFVDSNNYLHLLWNDNRNTPSLGSVYYTRSVDGGASYEANINIDSLGGISNGSLFVDSDVVYLAVTDYKTTPYTTIFKKITWLSVPYEPTIGTATGSNAQATVNFTAPANDGGSPITGYTVTSSPGGFTATGTTSPITVTGLTNGTSYTFTVTAANAVGPSVASAPSNAVTPVALADTTPPTDGIFTATASNGQVSLNWSGFSDSGGIAGYNLVYSTTSTPSSCSAGTQIYSGTGSSYVHTGLINNTTYFYRLCATDNAGNTSAGVSVSKAPGFATLIVNKSGSGTVTGGNSINCGSNCSETGAINSVLNLTTTADNGWAITGWSDGKTTYSNCEKLLILNSLSAARYGGSSYFTTFSCSVTLDQDTTISVTFADTTPTTGTISINSDAASTNFATATLTISCTDANGCSQMQFSNDNSTWSTAETYTTSKAWTLSSGDGTKTVYVKFKDAAGNISGSFSDTIIFNTTSAEFTSAAPYSDSLINTATIGYTLSEAVASGKITFTQTGGTVDPSSPQIYNLAAPDMTLGSHTVNTGLSLVNGAIYTVTFEATDPAGNVATPISGTNVSFDTTTASVTINTPASGSVTNNLSAGYTLSEAVSSGNIVVTRAGGNADAASPHTYTLAGAELAAGSHSVTTGMPLVDGAIYTVSIENVFDLAGNNTASVANASIIYDSTSVAITNTTPAANSAIADATVSYTQSEQAQSGAVTFTWTGGNADSGLPHIYILTGSDLYMGDHSIDTGLVLVDGAIYTVSFDATDMAGNAATTVSNAMVLFDNIHDITVTISGSGTITPSGETGVNHGDTRTFTATPDPGYHIASISGCGGNLTDNIFTTGTITADCAVTANFAIDTFTVTPTAGSGGAIIPSTPQTLNYGSTASFTVTPNTGYHITAVNGCGGTLLNNAYTTAAITADCTLAATFASGNTIPPAFTSTSPAANSHINKATVGYTLSAAVFSGKITFARTGGTADSSVNVYNFTSSDITAGTHSINTGLVLVNGAIYTVTFEATDSTGNTGSLSSTNVTYDTSSASVTISSPAANSVVNNAKVSYTLSEDVSAGEIVFTRTGGAADGMSPYKYTLAAADRTKGSYTIDTGKPLMSGTIYTLSFENVTDKAGNATVGVSNTSITYDSTAVAITNTSPASNGIITNSTVGYTLSEAATSGKVTFTRSGGNADSGSPHVYTLSSSDLYPGSHTVNTNLSLADGAFYTVSFDATDFAGNPATTVSNAMVYYDADYGIGPSGNADNTGYSINRVDGFDLIKLSLAFGSKPGDANWNPVCDLDNNGKVDGSDLITLGAHFGEVQ